MSGSGHVCFPINTNVSLGWNVCKNHGKLGSERIADLCQSQLLFVYACLSVVVCCCLLLSVVVCCCLLLSVFVCFCLFLSVFVCVCYSVCIVGMSVSLSVCLEEDEQNEEHLVWLFGG